MTAGLTVVIPHYGATGPAQRLVTALQRQQESHRVGPVQIVVSDDSSPDPFPETAGVTVVRRDVNGGFGSAVNAGARHARHDLLLVVNSDVEIGDDFVTQLVHQSGPWLPAVISPYVSRADSSNAWTGRHFPTVGQQAVEWLTPLARWRAHRALHEAVGHDTRVRPGITTTVDWAVGCVLLLPTQEFLQAGGFDEGFFMNCEETDLQRRLRQRGLPTVVLGQPAVVHLGGASSDPARRRAWLVRSRLRYAAKWGGRRRLLVSLLAASMVNLLWNSARSLAGRDVRPFRQARDELSLLRPEGEDGARPSAARTAAAASVAQVATDDAAVPTELR